jgi:hypothetical protein
MRPPEHQLPQHQLSKYQRNDLFRAIESSGMPVTSFQIATCIDRGRGRNPYIPVTLIRHSSSGSIFGIKPFGHVGPYAEEYYFRQQLGDGVPEEELFVKYQANELLLHWTDVLGYITNWARSIANSIEARQRYERTPDLWDELYQARDYSTAARGESIENTPFTSTEQARIYDQILQLKLYIKNTYELSSEQMSHVDARLDQAEQASHRIGRKDWILLFNGAVFSLILSDLIPPQAAQHILGLAIHGLGHLFGFGGPPPHLPPG